MKERYRWVSAVRAWQNVERGYFYAWCGGLGWQMMDRDEAYYHRARS